MTIRDRCPILDVVNLNRATLVVIRERTGHTKTSLGKAAGIHPTLIHRIENGERTATPPVIRKLADALDVPLHALLGPADDKVA